MVIHEHEGERYAARHLLFSYQEMHDSDLLRRIECWTAFQSGSGGTDKRRLRFYVLSGRNRSGNKCFVQSAKDVDEMVVIDGCPIGCARGVLKQQGVLERNYLVVTDLGFEKAKKFDLDPLDIQKVKDAVRKMLGPDSVGPADDACCGDGGKG